MTTYPDSAVRPPVPVEELERSLSQHLRRGVYVLDYRPFARVSSHPLWRVTVMIAGEERELVLKDLTPDGELPRGNGAAPAFLENPRRELSLYGSGLATAGITPAVIASSSDTARPWVLLELVDGLDLWQHEAGTAWLEAASLLAELHARAGPFLLKRLEQQLVIHNRHFYARWGERALANGDPQRRAELRFVVTRALTESERLLALPRTVIHGESSASNFIVRRSGRCVLVDWEMASAGPGLWDLAALVVGWDEGFVGQLAEAYRRRIVDLGAVVCGPGEFTPSLDACRLQQCIQWLGWASPYATPEVHDRDWLSDAVGIAERLGAC